MTEAITAADMRGLDVCEPAGENPEHELLWLELGKEDDRLFEIDCALQRIRDGVFGFCEETGHAIPAAILRARPWTRYARVSEPGGASGTPPRSTLTARAQPSPSSRCMRAVESCADAAPRPPPHTGSQCHATMFGSSRELGGVKPAG